jgi:uncharacterized damage-inducible protein DinB
LKEQLLHAWHCNNDKNLLLLHHIDDELLIVSPAAKSRTVGEQLAHLHNVRITWTEFVAGSLYQKSQLLPKDAVLTKPVLSSAFQASVEVIAAVIHASWDKGGKLPSFKAGLIPFITYLVSHESHHRGNILLTLKQARFKLPDGLKWGLWEWSK